MHVDSSRKYRLKVLAYIPDALPLNCGGYGYVKQGEQSVKLADEKGAWQYYLVSVKGPTDGWQRFETTIGPEGSGCKTTWDPQITCIGMNIWLGKGPGKAYLANFIVEEF